MRTILLFIYLLPFCAFAQSMGSFWRVESLTSQVGKELPPGALIHLKTPSGWYAVMDSIHKTVTMGTAIFNGWAVNDDSGCLWTYGEGATYISGLVKAMDNFQVGGNETVYGYFSGTNIYASGNIGVGTTSPSGAINIVSNASNPVNVDVYNSTAGTKANLVLRRGGGTATAPTKCLLGFGLGAFSFYGAYDNGLAGVYNSSNAQARVQALAEEDFTSINNEGTAIVFSTTPPAATPTLSERMRITGVGRIGVGTTAPTALLDVNSDGIRIRTSKTIATSTTAGNPGDISWDASYIYICVATNTWKRSAITTW